MKCIRTLSILATLWISGCDIYPPGQTTQERSTSSRTIPTAYDSTVDSQPVVIRKVEAEYPRLARDAQLEGIVEIVAHVTVTGVVDDTKIFKSSGSQSLDESALKAARQYQYKPATLNGNPVACWVKYEVEFKL